MSDVKLLTADEIRQFTAEMYHITDTHQEFSFEQRMYANLGITALAGRLLIEMGEETRESLFEELDGGGVYLDV